MLPAQGNLATWGKAFPLQEKTLQRVDELIDEKVGELETAKDNAD